MNKETLYLYSVSFNGVNMPMMSIEDCQRYCQEMRDANNYGYHEYDEFDCGNVLEDGKKIGHVSYNGKYWDLDNNLINETPEV